MGQLVFQATAGGQVALVGPNPSSSFSLNVPAVNGNLVTTGDTGTVTNTMLASSAYTIPGTIGSGTPNSGAFTTLSASSTVSGAGFTTYLASPPAIGGTTPNSGKFTGLTVGTSGITFSYGSNSQLASAKVMQVVNATATTQALSNSTSYSNTSLSASITPLFSTSKILVFASFVLYPANAISGAAVVGLNRGATLVADGIAFNSVGSSQITSAFEYLDSPATTSATTYTVQLKSSVATALVAFGVNSYPQVITLMEIAQ